MVMDTVRVLTKIKENLDESFEETRKRYDTLFVEFHRLLAEEGGMQANEYLARHLGEVDQKFVFYFMTLASELRKKGLVEAADSMEELGKGFQESLLNFWTLRVELLTKSADLVAISIANRYKNRNLVSRNEPLPDISKG